MNNYQELGFFSIIDGKLETVTAAPAERPETREYFGVEMAIVTTADPEHPQQNQDRVLIFTSEEYKKVRVVVVDVMGSSTNPDNVAEVAQKTFNEGFEKAMSSEEVQEAAAAQLTEGGFVYAMADIEQALSTSYAGDCQSFLFRASGAVLATAPESVFNLVENAVSAGNPGQTREEQNIFLQQGDWLVLMSDGMTDNLLAEFAYTQIRNECTLGEVGDNIDLIKAKQILAKRQEALIGYLADYFKENKNKTPQETARFLTSRASMQMQTEDGKKDDMTLVVMKINLS